MLTAGERVPEARLWTPQREPVEIAALAADGPVLLLFYLFDWSSTWTDEMELLRDRNGEFEAAGVDVYGVSRDSPWTHIAWSQALDLTFPLLSDWNGEATRAFGIEHEFRGLRGVSARSAFLLRNGAVEGAWRYADGEVPDVDALLAAVRRE